MATIQLPHDFKEFLRLLNAHGVEYLLVGGHAVIHYGYVRTTGGLDLWIAVNPANTQRLVEAMRAFGFSDRISAQTFLEEGPLFRMGMPPIRIELLTRVSGLKFEDAYSRRTRARMGDVDVDVISLDDLKANKRAAGRLKDLADLEQL